VTNVGPPKRAPAGVPDAAAHYLDNAAVYLAEIAKERGLELKPYDQHRPDFTAWFHGLYGDVRDRQICIQVVTDAAMAPSFTATLRGYVRMYPAKEGQLLYAIDGESAHWLMFEKRRVSGMAGLVTGVRATLEALSFACHFRLPHPTDPDAKA